MIPTNLSFEISASTVAWYGAVVATLSFGVAVWIAWSDRARVIIKYQKDMQVVGEGPYPKDKTFFVVTVINCGKRPVNIRNAGARMLGQSRKFSLFSDSFRLQGGRVLTEESPSTDFMVEQDLLPLDEIFYICAFDATGREYRKYVHRFPIAWRAWHWLQHRK